MVRYGGLVRVGRQAALGREREAGRQAGRERKKEVEGGQKARMTHRGKLLGRRRGKAEWGWPRQTVRSASKRSSRSVFPLSRSRARALSLCACARRVGRSLRVRVRVRVRVLEWLFRRARVRARPFNAFVRAPSMHSCAPLQRNLPDACAPFQHVYCLLEFILPSTLTHTLPDHHLTHPIHALQSTPIKATFPHPFNATFLTDHPLLLWVSGTRSACGCVRRGAWPPLPPSRLPLSRRA